MSYRLHIPQLASNRQPQRNKAFIRRIAKNKLVPPNSGRIFLPQTGAKRADIIETPVVVKKRVKAVKEYAPHEHFGSPLNICRVCGEKYSYVQKSLNAPAVSKN